MKNKNIILTSPLAGGARRTGKSEGYIKEKSYFTPSSVCSDFVRQTTSPAQGGSQTTGGFTLIELLVVVLIIGILAAVALPQYTKAVEKSKATQAITMLKSLGQAEMAYHLASGSFAEKFEDLDIDVPFAEDTTSAFSANITDTRANEDWSFQLNPSYKLIAARRLSGKYQGNGFFLYITGSGNVLDGKLRCIEKTGEAGQYCVKVFGATLGYQSGDLREYDMN